VRFLLDTNLVSEGMKPRQNPGASAWLRGQAVEQTYLSVVTWAELRHGIARMPAGARRERFRSWLENELPMHFLDRIFDINLACADAFGELMAQRERTGRTMAAMDCWLAATALVHDLTLVTRNTRDFADTGVVILNPWN